jgi:hypothetical protein
VSGDCTTCLATSVSSVFTGKINKNYLMADPENTKTCERLIFSKKIINEIEIGYKIDTPSLNNNNILIWGVDNVSK